MGSRMRWLTRSWYRWPLRWRGRRPRRRSRARGVRGVRWSGWSGTASPVTKPRSPCWRRRRHIRPIRPPWNSWRSLWSGATADAEFGAWVRDLWPRARVELAARDGGVVNASSGTVGGHLVQARDLHVQGGLNLGDVHRPGDG